MVAAAVVEAVMEVMEVGEATEVEDTPPTAVAHADIRAASVVSEPTERRSAFVASIQNVTMKHSVVSFAR